MPDKRPSDTGNKPLCPAVFLSDKPEEADFIVIFPLYHYNKIDVISVPLNDIQNILVNTATQYEVTDIELIGSKKYLNGIVNKIKETEISQYNEHKLNITIING